MSAFVGEAVPYMGGGVVGVLSFFLMMILTKRLPSPKERDILEAVNRQQLDTIKSQEDYIHILVKDMKENSDKFRDDIVPALTNALTTLTRIESEVIAKRRND